MGDGRDERNYINLMQERLQAMCPVKGCPPYRVVEKRSERGFKMQIVLDKTGPSANDDEPMPWSDWRSRRMDAKKHAAQRCLEALLKSGARPHDPIAVAKVVHETASGHGGSGGDCDEGGLVGPDATLPDDLTELLAVKHVQCKPVASGGAIDHSPGKENDEHELSSADGTSQRTCSTGNPPAQGSLRPANLGRLGEEYAVRWLEKQPWVQRDSVKWLNKDGQTPTRDIECTPIANPGRKSIEVKTRWLGFKRAGATPAQLKRLFDPDDDYMLLVLGFFENMIPRDGRPPSPPQVRVLPNLKWEDMNIKCAWAGRKGKGGSGGKGRKGGKSDCAVTFVWSIAEQKLLRAATPGQKEEPPSLCKPCSAALVKTCSTLNKCQECCKPWVFEAGEKQFYESKGLRLPLRCKPCRKLNSNRRGNHACKRS
jgi:hypothetical protein